MSDIVERLRHFSANTRDEYLHELAGRAADEIERLHRHADAMAGALETLMEGDVDVSHTSLIYTGDLFDRLASASSALAAYRKGEG